MILMTTCRRTTVRRSLFRRVDTILDDLRISNREDSEELEVQLDKSGKLEDEYFRINDLAVD